MSSQALTPAPRPCGVNHPLAFDARAFRDVAGAFVTGVTLVTAGLSDGVRIGVTVNSFTSLSLTPPLVLFCLRNEGRALPLIRQAGRFAIHILASDQEALSRRFAKDPFDWEGLAPQTAHDDAATPLVQGVCAMMFCEVEAIHPGGDHAIVIGLVRRIEADQARAPLVYHRGAYAALVEQHSETVGNPARSAKIP